MDTKLKRDPRARERFWLLMAANMLILAILLIWLLAMRFGQPAVPVADSTTEYVEASLPATATKVRATRNDTVAETNQTNSEICFDGFVPRQRPADDEDAARTGGFGPVGLGMFPVLSKQCSD
jgi:hypothetical protein